MSKEAIPVYECNHLTDAQQTTIQTAQILPSDIEGPAVLVRRHQQAYFPDDTAIYGVNATHLEGYDANGSLVATRAFEERDGAIGGLRQQLTERWKLARIKRSLGAVSFCDTPSHSV